MDTRLIWWPAVAMVALTVVVWLRMYFSRVAQMKRERIHPQAVATSAQAAAKLTDSKCADNFRNLFELPVLFYAAQLIAFSIHAADAIGLILAWAFVALRLAHSAIQCGYNRVMHRFVAYAAGAAVLCALWVWLAWRLLD